MSLNALIIQHTCYTSHLFLSRKILKTYTKMKTTC